MMKLLDNYGKQIRCPNSCDKYGTHSKEITHNMEYIFSSYWLLQLTMLKGMKLLPDGDVANSFRRRPQLLKISYARV